METAGNDIFPIPPCLYYTVDNYINNQGQKNCSVDTIIKKAYRISARAVCHSFKYRNNDNKSILSSRQLFLFSTS